MRSWAPLLGVALAAATVSLPAVAYARAPGTDPAAGTGAAAGSTPSSDQRKAEEHFQRAKELYSSGKYREAIAELDTARRLDPKAKELVMNLAIVYEKLDEYDEAIEELRTYLEMEGVTPAERAKAEGSIRRLEGAKRSAPRPSAAAPSAALSTAAAPPPPPARGRVDALTIGAASLAALGLGLGAGFGIYALGTRPGEGFVTGRDGTYATFQQKTTDAHDAAIVADVSLGVGLVAGLAAAWLYLGRTKTPASPAAGGGAATVSVAPSIGTSGGSVRVGGTF
jgi:tetratricopeptide (TPR) repeat protein